MKRTLFPFFAACCLCLLSACSSKPGDSDYKKFLSEELKDCSNVIEISNIKQTHAHEAKKNLYSVDIEYDLKLTKDMNLPTDAFFIDNSKYSKEELCVYKNFTEFKAGSTKHSKLTVLFAKTDNGWIGEK